MAIAEFFLAASLNLTRSAKAEQRAVRLEQVLSFVSQAGGSITLRRLRDHHNVGEGELRQIVATHPEQLRIETFEPGAKGGRPSARLIAIKNLKT